MSDTVITVLIVAARALHYGTALAAFGYCLFDGYLLSVHGGGEPTCNRVLLRWLASIFLASGLLWLAAETGNAGDGSGDMLKPQVWGSVLADTSFGHVFAFQLIIGGILVLASIALGTRSLAFLWGASLAGLAGLGHAVMLSGIWALLLPSLQAVHLLAAGFWAGGLLAITTTSARQNPQWGKALMRFSTLGHVAVALVVLSGTVISFALLGTPLPWNRIYVSLLVLKMSVVAAMTGLALFNRYVLVPRISKSPHASQQLMQISRFNLLLAGAAVLLVSLLGQLSPSIDQQ